MNHKLKKSYSDINVIRWLAQVAGVSAKRNRKSESPKLRLKDQTLKFGVKNFEKRLI